ncbi:MAG: DUF4163 domain-containing protein [Myroides sp.]|nr:DUF4163 domain-containing protein [Myroides sp.]
MKKTLLILFLSMAVISCKKDKSFSFEEKVYQKLLLETCVEDDCTEIKITTAEIIKPTDVISTKINQNNLAIITDILSFEDEKKTATTYDDIVQSFINAYTALVAKYPKTTIPWQATADNVVTFYNDNLLSFTLDYYMATGGASGFKGEKAIHYNPTTGEQYTNEQLFKNYNDFKQLVITKLKGSKSIDKGDTIQKDELVFDESSFQLPEDIFIYEDSIVLNFNSSELGALANKIITITLTKEEVAPYLSFDLTPKPNTNK